MLKLRNLKKTFVIAMILMLLTFMSSSVFATNTIVITGNNTTTGSGLQTIPTTNSTNNNTTSGTITTIPTTNNTATTNNTVTTSNSTGTGSTSSNLPKTGIDYSALFLLAVCAVSGVYAYVKIRDYDQIKY